MAMGKHSPVLVRTMSSCYEREASGELKCEEPFLQGQTKFTLLCIPRQAWLMPQEGDYSISYMLQCFSYSHEVFPVNAAVL